MGASAPINIYELLDFHGKLSKKGQGEGVPIIASKKSYPGKDFSEVLRKNSVKKKRLVELVTECLDKHDDLPYLLILFLCQLATILDQPSHPDDLHALR